MLFVVATFLCCPPFKNGARKGLAAVLAVPTESAIMAVVYIVRLKIRIIACNGLIFLQ